MNEWDEVYCEEDSYCEEEEPVKNIEEIIEDKYERCDSILEMLKEFCEIEGLPYFKKLRPNYIEDFINLL